MARTLRRAQKKLDLRVKAYDRLSTTQKDSRKRPGSMNPRKQG
jgi:hypothetical protein